MIFVTRCLLLALRYRHPLYLLCPQRFALLRSRRTCPHWLRVVYPPRYLLACLRIARHFLLPVILPSHQLASLRLRLPFFLLTHLPRSPASCPLLPPALHQQRHRRLSPRPPPAVHRLCRRLLQSLPLNPHPFLLRCLLFDQHLCLVIQHSRQL